MWEKTRGEIRPGKNNLPNSAKLAQLGNSACRPRGEGGRDWLFQSLRRPPRRIATPPSSGSIRSPRTCRARFAWRSAGPDPPPSPDNQSQLLALAKLEPSKRAKAHVANPGEARATSGRRWNLLEPPAKKPDPEMQILSRLDRQLGTGQSPPPARSSSPMPALSRRRKAVAT